MAAFLADAVAISGFRIAGATSPTSCHKWITCMRSRGWASAAAAERYLQQADRGRSPDHAGLANRHDRMTKVSNEAICRNGTAAAHVDRHRAGSESATARRRRDEPRHIDALAIDVRTFDIGSQPPVLPDRSGNSGGSTLSANFLRVHLKGSRLHVHGP